VADALDPYHVWLGIPPEDQPPDRHRLLGIDRSETDPDVIEHAAEMRIAYLDSLCGGDRAEPAQRIREELKAARGALLTGKALAERTPSGEDGRFDGYHKWLGIPPAEQPPNHYRLLGVRLFESDPDVIRHAADMRTAYVRRFQTGKHSEQVQQIRNQIAAAGLCLRDPQRRSKYDAQLRGRPAAEDEPSPKVESATTAEPTMVAEPAPTVPPPEGIQPARRSLPPEATVPVAPSPTERARDYGEATPSAMDAWWGFDSEPVKPARDYGEATPSAMDRVMAVPRMIDRVLLGRIAPEGYEIMRWFLRGLVLAVPVGVVVLVIWMIVHEPTQPKIPRGDAEFSLDLGGGVTLEMVLIPAGSFTMGDDSGDSDERPVHRVTITKPFYLGKYEVTQEQWQAVMGNNPSRFRGAKNPVEMVSWNDCQAFIAKLNQKYAGTGRRFSLPSEAQWEYACRAGSTTRYGFGDDETALDEYGWFRNNSGGTTHPVGQKKPNGWRLHDMHGNVWEWCEDRYDSGYYKNSPTADPTGPASGSYRVIRGGYWYADARYCGSALRGRSTPACRYNDFGFRLASVPVDVSSEDIELEAPEPLRMNPVSPQTVEAGTRLVVPVSVENAAFWSRKLTYSLAPPAPPGARIDPRTGTFTWTPNQQHAPGTYDVTVTVRGPSGQQDEQTFRITVTKPPPVSIAPDDAEITLDLGGGATLEMVLIPAGSFTMGDDDGDYSDERPAHRVTITKPFYLGKYEVTQEQWQAVMGNNPSRFRGAKNPVEWVSWNDCQAFVAKLNAKYAGTGRKFSLPTEAQWEYACRAGSTTRYSFGDREASLDDYAWFDDNSDGRTHPVGQKNPNAFRLCDMDGNVWEWCQDWYDSGYYRNSPTADPTGPASGLYRVYRGGSWSHYAGDCRSAFRSWGAPDYRSSYLGFRLASVPVDASSRR